MTIQVVKREKRFTIIIDGIGNISYQSPKIANNEATKLKEKYYPKANLVLVEVENA